MREFNLPVRVYIEDTDAGGIVYYVNYLKFMERARTEFMRQLGFDKPAILDDGKLLVVHSLETQYKRPALLDDALQVTAQVIRLKRSFLVFRQQVKRGDTVMCEADIKVACVERESMKPTAIPDIMREAVAAHVVSK